MIGLLNCLKIEISFALIESFSPTFGLSVAAFATSEVQLMRTYC